MAFDFKHIYIFDFYRCKNICQNVTPRLAALVSSLPLGFCFFCLSTFLSLSLSLWPRRKWRSQSLNSSYRYILYSAWNASTYQKVVLARQTIVETKPPLLIADNSISSFTRISASSIHSSRPGHGPARNKSLWNLIAVSAH